MVKIPDDDVLLAARELTHRTDDGRWKGDELKKVLEKRFGDCPRLVPRQGPLGRLLQADELVHYKGATRTKYQAVLPTTLNDILERAATREDSDKVIGTGTGRRGGDDFTDRRRHTLTSSQLKYAKAGARKLGKWMDGDGPEGDTEHGMKQVGREHLAWAPGAGIGEIGDWGKAIDDLRAACDASDTAERTRSQYIGGLRTLLDLAATRRWIPRTEEYDADGNELPPEWAEVHNAWREAILGIHQSATTPVRQLLRALSRQGYEGDPGDADWGKVIPQLKAYWDSTETAEKLPYRTRRGYRLLRAKGMLTGPEWDASKRQKAEATGLVPDGSLKQVSRMYGTDPHQRAVDSALENRPLGWPVGWDPHQALVEGPYGLRDWALMRSATLDQLERLGLPERRKGQVRLKAGTIHLYLKRISFATGFLSKRYDVDWAEEDLRAFCEPERLMAYHTFLKEETDAGLKTRADRIHDIGSVLRTAARLANHRDDPTATESFEEATDLLIGDGPEGYRSSLHDRLLTLVRERPGQKAQRQKQVAMRIERTWTRQHTTAEFAYDQMWWVGAAALQHLVEDHGPLGKQIEAVVGRGEQPEQADQRKGIRQPLDRSWARDVQDLVLWFNQLAVPYRTDALKALDRQDITTAHGLRPPIQAHVHANKRKKPNYTWHKPNLATAESRYPVQLLRLYLIDGGARDVLLTRPDGSRWDPADGDRLRYDDEARRHPKELSAGADARGDGLRVPFYPNDLRDARNDYVRMSGSTIRRLIARVPRTVLRRAPNTLGGVSYGELEDADKVLTPHSFRHSYAKWRLMDGGDGKLDEVRQVLDHKDPMMLLTVYAGTSPSDYDVGAAAGDSFERRSVAGTELPNGASTA